MFETVGRFGTGVAGSGANTFDTNGYTSATGATQASQARIREQSDSYMEEHFFDNGAQFMVSMKIDSVSTASSKKAASAWVAGKVDWSGAAADNSTNLVPDHHGYRVYSENAAATILYATTADGTTETATDISAGLTLTNTNLYYSVMSASDCKFYVNGVLKATHTTNLPNSSGGIAFWVGSSNIDTTGTITSIFNCLNLKINAA
jgi:hypothetical protein